MISVFYILAIWGEPAYAYIDPGTGSMLIQAAIAAIAAASVFIGMSWSRVRLFLYRIFGKNNCKGKEHSDGN
jgi:hypothetical protein